MTTLASDRNWILDPVRLKLVHQCRRLIHTEFGVKLHLTEENLAQQLADYAQKTRSSHLVRVWNTLKAQVPELAGIETGGDARAVEIAGHHAFVASGARGLVVVDLAEPTAPRIAGGFDPRATDMARGLTLATPALRLVCATGEPLFPDQRALIEAAFGVPVAVEYGFLQ